MAHVRQEFRLHPRGGDRRISGFLKLVRPPLQLAVLLLSEQTGRFDLLKIGVQKGLCLLLLR